ncbi:hypothetical protein BVC71_13765 [Marivivens niveibacter]|uniref:Phospholipase D n=1 Tax=Marivivens niveibacter TaxID=1930667 RepID=A0A251WWQ9_9RHOB|nr:phospholipase D-like domain-containing protein [Marivivens niveibacter]OUD08585.1 hypothetical protein BVC71_13765 [Marivivens niveibacter]
MSLTFSHFLIVFGIVVAVAAVVTVLQQRRTPQSAIAWILAIVLVPYVTLPVFMVLGFRKKGSKFSKVKFAEPEPQDRISTPLSDNLRQLGASIATGANSLDLHSDADTARTSLFDMLDGAETRIDALFYILQNDALGREFVDRLTEKAEQGVAVRLNLDWLGSMRRPSKQIAQLTRAGGEVRYFLPFFHHPATGNINLRNHRKMVIADGKYLWSGGRNIGAEYLTAQMDRWHDLSFCASGPVVQSYVDLFDADWDPEQPQTPQPRHIGNTGTAQLQLVPSGPDVDEDPFHDGLLTAIYRANQRVWIATPYFIPTSAMQHGLLSAAKRGVDVRIFVPEKSNHRMTDFARGLYLRDLQEAGAKVYLFQNGMQHAKAGLVDHSGWVGSANFDVRSLLLNFENILFCYDDTSVQSLKHWFAQQRESSKVGMPKAGKFAKLVEGIFRLVSPVL